MMCNVYVVGARKATRPPFREVEGGEKKFDEQK